MSLHRRTTLALGSVGAALALLLSGCDLELSAPPEPDLDRLESVGEMEVPAGADVLEYYSSEVDFHGGRDEVYVLALPASGRTGIWDPSTYTAGILEDGTPTPAEIIESANADITHDELSSLRCAEPRRANQNYLLICYDAETDTFTLFEQIF